jgi:hypothetical protein
VGNSATLSTSISPGDLTKTLGLTIPQSLLLRANQVIDP